MAVATPQALGAAHFENIGEIGCIVDLQAEAAGLDVVIVQRQAFEGAGVPEKPGAPKVEQILGDQPPAVAVGDLRVRQIHNQHGVIIADGRTQE